MEEQDLREFDGERQKYISYYVHEAEVARSETHSKRWMIAAAVAFAALVITNFGWVVYESLYEDTVTETYETQADGDHPVFVNGTGEMHYNDKD